MRKKIISVIIAAVMVISALPTFAYAGDYAVDGKKAGSAENPLIVNYDWWEGINYVSLGDSMAYGYGLDDAGIEISNFVGDDGRTIIPKMAEAAHKVYKKRVNGSYPDLIQDYFEKNRLSCRKNYFQGAVCASRVDDICTFIDSKKCPPDKYCTNVMLEYMIGKSAEQVNREIGEAVKNADFITITAGGNNVLCYPVANIALKGWDAKGNLARYYGKSAADTFYKERTSTADEAAQLDRILHNGGEYEKDVNFIFDTIEAVLYTAASFVYNEKILLDLIHEKNRHAVIAITGIPPVGIEYDIKVGSIIIDLEKILLPLAAVLNTIIKNQAESRSSFVRYIDISDVELFTTENKTIELSDFVSFVIENMNIVHPTYAGHELIANRIMENFRFSARCELTGKISNQVNNYKTTAMSRSGILKINNLKESMEGLSLKGLITLAPCGSC